MFAHSQPSGAAKDCPEGGSKQRIRGLFLANGHRTVGSNICCKQPLDGGPPFARNNPLARGLGEGGESEHVPLKERMMDEGRRGIVLRPSSTASTASLGRSDDDEDRSK